MGDWTIHELIDFAARWVLGFSALYAILPPTEYFADYPNFQKKYALGLKLIQHFGSLDLRGKFMGMYDSYKTRNGNGAAKPENGGK